jgi:pimeloyl-ACP methyl ester carboxylesterase
VFRGDDEARAYAIGVTDAAAPVPDPWLGEPGSTLVTVDTGERIHYLDWGGPDVARADPVNLPPLLLIHGVGHTGWAWTPVARRLRHATRVLAVDVRGHGLSDSPRSGYDLESLAFDALTVLVANNWGRDAGGPPAVVAGHGMGAMVGATMARLQPGSICALALVDGGWEDIAEATGQTPAEFEQTLGDPPEVLSSMDAFLADRREFDPATWDEDQERAARSTVDEKHAGHVAPVTRLNALRGCVSAMFGYQPADVLAGLPMPLLVAVAESGAADDEVVRERHLALDDIARLRVERGLPPPHVERYIGAGHNLMRYHPVRLSRDLRHLLDEGRAYQRS